MPISRPAAVLAACILIPFCAGADTGDNPSKAVPTFRFGILMIADTAAKAAALRAPGGPQKIVVADEPLLATAEFADSVTPYFGAPITPDSVQRLVGDVTGFLKSHGQHLVSVEVPPQNIANGEFRLVVVVGHYSLQRLLIGGGESEAAAMKGSADATQIVIDRVPSLATGFRGVDGALLQQADYGRFHQPDVRRHLQVRSRDGLARRRPGHPDPVA